MSMCLTRLPLRSFFSIPTILEECVKTQDEITFSQAYFKEFGTFALVFECAYFVEVPDFQVHGMPATRSTWKFASVLPSRGSSLPMPACHQHQPALRPAETFSLRIDANCQEEACGQDEAPRSMRTFSFILGGQLISMLGTGLTGFALGVWIYQQTGQATPFALTVLFATLPRLLLLPVAGSLADRWDRRWVMIFSDTGSALVTLGAFLLLSFGQLEIWMIYLIAALGSVFEAFQEPAYTAAVTMLVPRSSSAALLG